MKKRKLTIGDVQHTWCFFFFVSNKNLRLDLLATFSLITLFPINITMKKGSGLECGCKN